MITNAVLVLSISTLVAVIEASLFVNLMLLAPLLWFVMIPGGAIVAGLLAEGNRRSKVICFSMTLVFTVFVYLAVVILLSVLVHLGFGNLCVIEGFCPIGQSI